MDRHVQDGDTITIHYTAKLTDGSLFDSTEGRDPFAFQVGADNVIPGISSGVVGMREGDRKTLTVPPEEAFGPHDPKKVAMVEVARLPEGVGVGDEVQDGESRRWRVHRIDGDQAVIDANHQLAGQTLTLDVEVVAIR